MDLESTTDELYGLIPAEFTAARNARASEARKAGFPAVATSLKELRKPSAGAWLANLLVRERPDDLETLVALGDSLRAPRSALGGDEIRKVSKQKSTAVSTLLRHAQSRASYLGHPASASAVEELGTTLDAAFADPDAAAALLRGRLTSGLQYSGLGFGAQTDSGPPARPKSAGSGRAPGRAAGRAAGPVPGRAPQSEARRIAAQRALDKATQEAEEADGVVVKARHAVEEAAAELRRLESAEATAVKQAKTAHARETTAKKALDKLR
jgi:hypothetical protein